MSTKATVKRQIRQSTLSLLIACLTLAGIAGHAATNATGIRHWRGTGSDPHYHSFLIALDGQRGTTFTNVGGIATNYFPDLHTRSNRYHYNGTNHASSTNLSARIAFKNPIAAFGSRFGGTPLYVGEKYRWGMHGGGNTNVMDVEDSTTFDVPITVRSKTTWEVGFMDVYIPNPNQGSDWTTFATNNFTKTQTNYGVRITVELVTGPAWGIAYDNRCYVINFEAISPAATNYFFEVYSSGFSPSGYWMVHDSDADNRIGSMFMVEFDARPALRPNFIEQAHFTGFPLPPEYAGRSLGELTNLTAVITNDAPLALMAASAAYTNLDTSPELKRHPILDKFVADYRNDPLALTEFVINEIELSDPIADREFGPGPYEKVSAGGVSRGALGAFQERQGSPLEQCALLVYLLRQAGYRAGYVFPRSNNVKMLDFRVSKLLRMQVKGAVDDWGDPHVETSLITLDYPWVVAAIGNQCAHIFPWLKDTEVVEGLNLYDYMPAIYPSGYHWIRDYLYRDTNIVNLSAVNTPADLFPRYLKKYLLENHPGVSVDDIGVRCFNRKTDYGRWEDLPRPNVLDQQTNIALVADLVSGTNAVPALKNIFDLARVQVFRGGTKLFDTGKLRQADLHNRKFVLYTNSNLLTLWLAPFRPGTSGSGVFTDEPDLLNTQFVQTNLQDSDNTFKVTCLFDWNRAVTNATYYFDVGEIQQRTYEFNIGKQELGAICMNMGRVTPQMLDVHAEALWGVQRKIQTNASAPLSVHEHKGTAAYLLGMGWFERLSRFSPVNQRLHKIRVLSDHGIGLGKLRLTVRSNQLEMIPMVDMVTGERILAFNGTARPDLGAELLNARNSFEWFYLANASAEEHEVIRRSFDDGDSISTVGLLHLAEDRSSPSKAGIIELTSANYVSKGDHAFLGYTSKMLKEWDTQMWATIVDQFEATDGHYTRCFITPGEISNDGGSYTGMGALIFSSQIRGALIGGGANGGAGGFFPPLLPSTWSLSMSAERDYVWEHRPPSAPLALKSFSALETGQYFNSTYSFDPSPQQIETANAWAPVLGLTVGDINSIGVRSKGEQSVFGISDFLNVAKSWVADPVNPVTGEFYIDAVDLSLPGPMPLELRRNYLSQNRSDSQLGHGWKLSLIPHLVVTTNSAGNAIAYAAEMDGSVLAYRKSATNQNIWVPLPEDNPTAATHTTQGIGSKANFFNAFIEKVSTNWYVKSPDGSQRLYEDRKYPIDTGPTTLQRRRPYLTEWRDQRGNAYRFFFENDDLRHDYGELVRVESSNGGFLAFRYETYGRISEAYTGDGRKVGYEYDDYGDLVKVTLPDASAIQYTYLQSNYVSNGQTKRDSKHLLNRELKPDGRALRNEYDTLRRVTNQFSTVGADLTAIRNATFTYANNFNITNAHTNMVSGYTLITDVHNKVTRYDYTNGLITKIIDPLNQTNAQEWYFTGSESAGAYRRSLKSETDKRGLKTTYLYDANGNVTNTVITGDLTGDGINTQTATNIFTYNTNNLLTESVDPSGRKTEIRYHPQFPFLPEHLLTSASGTILSTNLSEYYSVTNIFTNGTLKLTNVAVGVLRREIRAFGSPDASTNEWERDGRGFITRQIQYTGTGDPNVTNSFFYNARGEMVEATDAVGRKRRFDYDGLGRLRWTEILDETGKQLSAESTYYNANGEVEWKDGPRYDPEDYVWNDYDGAGRQTTQIRWRSQAKADGSGVEAVPGYDQFATAFQEWDGFGNLTKVIDPRGSVVTNAYDAIGQKVLEKVIDANGVVLRTEHFKYEAGGQLALHTNALSGITEKLYAYTGKPRYQKNPDGSTNQWRYYLDGRAQREIQPNGAYWQTTYDDANRKITKVFYSASSNPLATNITEFDCRGNAVRTEDAAGFAFTNKYDALDRVKWTAGPVVAAIRPAGAPGFPPLPPSVQQAVTSYFDAAGVVTTNINAAGHITITWKDALGRVTRAEQYRNSLLERETTTTYAANHHSVTVTNSSGVNAIASTTYTDNSGASVLSVAYPSVGVRHFTRSVYDSVGNPIFQTQASVTNSTLIEWSSISMTYDGLNRPTWKSERDGAVTTFQYDPAGNLTNRVSPGGLASRAIFNSAGQKTQDYILGGGLGSRTNTYTYTPLGLLASRSDSRGVVCDYAYDDWLRPLTNTHSGPLNEQDIITTFKYDVRGLLTNLVENFVDPLTGPSTTINRTYTAYSQLKDEAASINSSPFYSTMQAWDAAGNRSSVGYGYGQFGFNMSFRSDGLPRSFAGPTGSGLYNYDSGGQLVLRDIIPGVGSGQRVTTIGQRDGMGRPLSITNSLNGAVKLLETLSWTGDGLLASHTIGRTGDFTNSMEFLHASQTRRLVEERLNLDPARRHTNTFTFDAGGSQGPGVLTKASQGGALWSGVTNALLQITTETNNVIQHPAYGAVNGPATVSVLSDGQPMPVSVSGTQTLRWLANLELTPGTHQLNARALHPSGQYTATVTNWFTNNVGNLTNTVTYDGAGNITQRIWRTNGVTVRTLLLSWDARGRLWKAVDRDATQSGRDWAGVYDGFGRLLRTTELTVTNGTNFASATIDHYYDPEHEFLEIGVSENGQTTWKVMGPDTDGVYGGQNGTGGFEAIVPGPELFCPLIADFRGNLHGVYDVDHNMLMWYPSRIGGYGGVPGYRPLPLGHVGVELGAKCAWRNRWSTSFGLAYLGGNWLSLDNYQFAGFDERGFAGGQGPGHTFCMGNPADYWDPDGRLAKGFNAGWNSGTSPHGSSGGFNAGYLLGGLFGAGTEGLGEGSAILANTATFGQVNGLSTYANTLQGGAYDASRAFSQVAVGSLMLAGGVAAWQAPSLYVPATTAALSPWAPVAIGGGAAGAYTHSQGGSAGQIAAAVVTGGAVTYTANPFPMGGMAPNTGAARLGSLTPAQARQIQAFSDRFGAEVNVVGSRAAGRGLTSDFDYVIGGNNSLRHSADYYLPRGPLGTGAGGRGIDIFNANVTPLDPTRPFVQFTPGSTP